MMVHVVSRDRRYLPVLSAHKSKLLALVKEAAAGKTVHTDDALSYSCSLDGIRTSSYGCTSVLLMYEIDSLFLELVLDSCYHPRHRLCAVTPFENCPVVNDVLPLSLSSISPELRLEG